MAEKYTRNNTLPQRKYLNPYPRSVYPPTDTYLELIIHAINFHTHPWYGAYLHWSLECARLGVYPTPSSLHWRPGDDPLTPRDRIFAAELYHYGAQVLWQPLRIDHSNMPYSIYRSYVNAANMHRRCLLFSNRQPWPCEDYDP